MHEIRVQDSGIVRSAGGDYRHPANRGIKVSHTPGPWEIDDERDSAIRIWKRMGEFPISGIIATVRTTTWRHNEQQEAQRCNAHLIAAAPEMYEALKKIRKTIADSEQWWMNCPDRGGFDADEIDAVIAKAEGK